MKITRKYRKLSKFEKEVGGGSTSLLLGGGSTSSSSWLDNYLSYDSVNDVLISNKTFASEGSILAYLDNGQDLPSIFDNLPKASNDAYGVVKIGSGINVLNGVISLDSTAVNPNLSFTNNILSVNSSTVDLSSLSIDSYTKTESDNKYSLLTHNHSSSYSPLSHNHSGVYALIGGSGTQDFSVKDLTVAGNLTIIGKINEVETQIVKSENDLIITRANAITGLIAGTYTGIQATKYDGVNDGQLVFGSDGFARVGDVGQLQVLATRENTPLSNGIAYFDNTTKQFKTKAESSLSVAYAQNSNTLDGINSTSFLRSDVNDTLYGEITTATKYAITLGADDWISGLNSSSQRIRIFGVGADDNVYIGGIDATHIGDTHIRRGSINKISIGNYETTINNSLRVNGNGYFTSGAIGELILSDDSYGGELGLITGNDESIGVTNGSGKFFYGGGIGEEKLTIDAINSRVGINNQSPSQALDVNGKVISTGYYINDTNTQLIEGSGSSLRLQTNSGYVELGSQNTGWAHFKTDRAAYYFDKTINCGNDRITSYASDFQLQRQGSTKLTLTSVGATVNGELSIYQNVEIGTTNDTVDRILKIQSKAAAGLHLIADTDNVTENQNPHIFFSQDGGANVRGNIGYNDAGLDAMGNTVSLTSSNAFVIHNEYITNIEFAINGARQAYITTSGSFITSGLSQASYFRSTGSGGFSCNEGNGRGYNFWGSNSYKIYMSQDADATWGGALIDDSDYHTYFKMSGVKRGWIFKNTSTTTANGGAVLQISGEGNVHARGTIQAYSTSDKRLKENIRPLSNSLYLINQLEPVSYYWNEKGKELQSINNDKKYDEGLIAQDVEKVLPHVIGTLYDEYKGIDYTKLIPHLIGAIKELSNEITELKKQIK